jgi:sialate O-acetylesterase
MHTRKLASLLAIAFLFSPIRLPANVQLPAIFGDHMVLQEGMKLPVWGTADPNEAVVVTVGGETASTKAGADGKWRVNLSPLPEKSVPVTLTVTGKNSLTFQDVLVGDVWICSGQSNMEFNLGGHGFGGAANAADVVPKANDPQLRLFLVAKNVSLDPVPDVKGTWQLCTPETASPFSAVGYFFGRDLRKNLNRPVGLIGTYWGGMPAQAFTSLSGLQKDPELVHYVEYAAKIRADLPAATAAYPAKLAAYQAQVATWKATVGPSYETALANWNSAVKAAQASGQNPPRKPKPSSPPPPAPAAINGGPSAPANLYNAMIFPLIPFGIKGAIWYQGESNAPQALEYRTLFSRMIKDWRENWGEGDFPFLFVQLAAFKSSAVQNWPYLREAQLMTLSLPNTGMASAVDIGNPINIHPTDKDDVGHRLALAARHVAYGQNMVYSGPIYQAMTTQGGSINLTFTQKGSGLIIGTAPWTAPGMQPLSTDKLVGFTIAGEDKKWVPADAKIVDNKIVVSSAEVPAPVAVRYDWANAPQGNLYNKENLPASPFRTDDWPDPAMGPIIPATPPNPAK